MSTPDLIAADRIARARAMDPQTSFLVQAPAGSGKTELLIQRYLRLLGCVEEPEEVLAITFTRKAAGEVRTRVIQALRQADTGQPPVEPHLRVGYELAQQVLADKRRQHWQLQRHPARLAISTIDAVNAWLAGRAPLTAGNTALHRVTERPAMLYREAARSTLNLLGGSGSEADLVADLLAHLDNNAERFERLVALMLPRRDQWLRHIPLDSNRSRPLLEQGIAGLCEHSLRCVREMLPDDLNAVLPQLMRAAAENLAASHPDSPHQVWLERAMMPDTTVAELPLWRSLAAMLLTRSGEWRKSVTRSDGFPAGTDARTHMLAVQSRCRQLPDLQAALREVQWLPEAGYADRQWEILESLLDILPLAAAGLRLAFADRGMTDFAEVAADAMSALGRPDDPSELGLALDYRVRHILVDEFQDTSAAQFDLLQQLVAGWEQGDGRTLFLVGDPMQSIYRFREAEVRLFLAVRDHGLGDIDPEFLQLQANFRSDPLLVSWFNRTFSATFPRRTDAVLGAVGFAESAAARTAWPDAGVALHWLATADPRVEAEGVADVVAGCRSRWPGESIAILVRSRGHAAAIIAALREARIGFVAPDLEVLEYSPVAQDLLALTRALTHPADRLAWLAVLRAPWCGLALADLQRLAAPDRERPIWELAQDAVLCRQLSADGQRRLERLVLTLKQALTQRGRLELRDLVEGTWLALGGPATITDPGEAEAADAFLEQLEAADVAGDCADPEALADDLASRRATLAGGAPVVQIMTMHKAKGLQFDTVILPGLGRVPRGDDRPLLLWHEAPLPSGVPGTVLAAMAASGDEQDPLYEFLWRLEKDKRGYEQDRLLYVACTRARRRLHLFATIHGKAGDDGAVTAKRPSRGSLLERLWPAVEIAAVAALQDPGFETPANGAADGVQWLQPAIRRLRIDWRPPPPPPAWRPPQEAPDSVAIERLEYDWANRWAMHAGSVVHRWLQLIAAQGIETFDAERIRHLQPVFRRMLLQLGTDEEAIDQAVMRVTQALCATLTDPLGRWVLSGSHAMAQSELALTVCDGQTFRRLVLDRSFVTADGQRWLIDYKTSSHEGGKREEFLALEIERHRDQLRRYRDALQATGVGGIRSALYFPLLGVLREVDLEVPGPPASEAPG